MDDLLDTAGIAQMLGLTQKYVTDRLTKQPTFPRPHINLSRRVRRWRRKDVDRWLAEQRKAA